MPSCNSIKSFDFFTLYTTSPHSKLKDKLKELIQRCFIDKNYQFRYKPRILEMDNSHFVQKHSDFNKKAF